MNVGCLLSGLNLLVVVDNFPSAAVLWWLMLPCLVIQVTRVGLACSKQENELLGQVGSSIEQGEGEMGERLLVRSPENVDR